jgi:hypothetical protein
MSISGYALVIGVGGDLPNTVNDADGLAKVLKDPARCAYDPAKVNLLTAEKADRAGILTALDQLAQADLQDATVVIYFSGHGYRVESSTDENYFLMPAGYDINQLRKSAISGKEFADKLAVLKTARLLLLLDCCHAQGVGETKAAGLTLTKSPLPPEAQALFAQGGGRIVITSSRASEASFAGKPYSLFTRALIEALCAVGITEGEGYVKALDLALYASHKVAEWSKDRQHPTADTQKADNFAVAYYAAGAKAPLPLDLPPIDVEQVEAENQPALRYLQQVQQSGGINFGQGNQIQIDGDVVAGDKVKGDKVMGNKIDARGSQGAIFDASGPINQNFGSQTTIDTGGAAYIAGNVKARTFVGRDQINTNITTQGASPEEFAKLLTTLRTLLTTVKLDGDERTAVEEDLTKVAEQAAKPEPKLSLIKRGLGNIQEVLEGAAGVGGAVITLAPLVQKAIEMAQQVFK